MSLWTKELGKRTLNPRNASKNEIKQGAASVKVAKHLHDSSRGQGLNLGQNQG